MEVSKLAIQKFMYTGLVAAVAAPMVLASFSSVIDTPWGVALNRSVKVGSSVRSVLKRWPPLRVNGHVLRRGLMRCASIIGNVRLFLLTMRPDVSPLHSQY